MKKRLSLMTAVLICSLMYSTCDLFKDIVKEPEVTLKSVNFTEISFEGLTLLSKIDVKNDNSISIPFPKIDWDLSVIGNKFINGVIQSEGTLKSNDSTEIQFPVKFTYLDLINTITALINNEDNAKYKIDMIAHIPVPELGDLSFPFNHEGKIPIMRLPEMEVADAPSTTFGSYVLGVPTSASISFALNIKNNGNVAVKVSELLYNFRISNTSLSQGGVPDKPTINPGATEKITVIFPLKASDLLNTTLITIISGSNFNYNLDVSYKFGLPEFPFLNELSKDFSF